MNISFTTSVNSKELHDAIKRANDTGILIIAAAGNDNELLYPAAYGEVMAVGSVKSNGEVSEFSPSGVEVVAPGELITSTDVFDTLSTHSGTSLAAPLVTGIAARLWRENPNCTNDFIRCMIDASANLYGDKNEYGFGLVDYDYAEQLCKLFSPLSKSKIVYGALMQLVIVEKNLRNQNLIHVSDTSTAVEGAWLSKEHNDSIGDFKFTTKDSDGKITVNHGREFILDGCILQDSGKEAEKEYGFSLGLAGTYNHPFFHGFAKYHPCDGVWLNRNYIASYIYMTQVANAFCHSKDIPSCPDVLNPSDTVTDPDTKKTISDSSSMKGCFTTSGINGKTWKNIETYLYKINKNTNFKGSNNIHRGLLVWGMAIHHAGDIFAHSAYGAKGEFKDKRILHYADNDKKKEKPFADNPKYLTKRYQAAQLVIQNTLGHLDQSHPSNSKPGSLEDFKIQGTFNDEFYLSNFGTFVNEISSGDASQYNNLRKATN